MKITKILLILIVIQSYSLTVISQNLQFYREDITFRLEGDTMATDAVYQFCNVGDKDIHISLFYPFPENTMELIDSILVTDMKTKKDVPYREGKSGVFFGISVAAYGQAAYGVYYRQKSVGQKFTYILTSTETWHRPLEFANFILKVPLSMTIDSLTYPPDSSYIQKDHRYYSWKKKDFMPDRDFEIYF